MFQTNLQGISTIRTNDTVNFKTKVKQKQEKNVFSECKRKDWLSKSVFIMFQLSYKVLLNIIF